MPTPVHHSRPGGFGIQPASMPEARQLDDFLYMSEGLSSSYLIVTGEGRVVINTGMGFEAPVHKRNYDAVDSGPVRYILLTQAHVDHVGGVDVFREEGTEIVAHEGNQAYQDEDALLRSVHGGRSSFAFAETLAKAAEYGKTSGLGGAAQARPTPTITFSDRYDFELGGIRFELLHVPGGETTESMAIWLPQHRICLAGNLFSALFGHVPNLVTIRGDRYRDALSFIDSLERVMALEPERLLVGHGPPIEGADVIRWELERLRDALRFLHEETVKRMNDGVDVWTAMREIQLPPELSLGEGYGKLSWCVRAIYENYLGWFHHESTTELYPVPASSVHGDLVDLAGPEAIAKLARGRLEAGQPVEAIHLAEIVLNVDPSHGPALDIDIAAHEQLEAESENFWMLSWLRREITTLKERR